MNKNSYNPFFGYILSLTLVLLSGTATIGQEVSEEAPEVISKNDKLEGQYYFIEGEKFFILDDYEKAFEYFMLAHEKDPENPAINYKIAQVLSQNEEYVKALPYALTAKEQGPENKYYYLIAAELYTTMSNFKDAAVIYEEMLANIPESDKYLFDLAAIYLYQNDLDKALETYDRAKKAFGPMEQITVQKQKIYLRQNKLQDAINEGNELINEFPGVADYVISQAEILISNEELDSAVVYLDQVLRDEPENAQANILMSEVFRKRGQERKAIELLEKAFINPELNFNAKVQLMANYIAKLPNDNLEDLIIRLSEALLKAHPGETDGFAIAGDLQYKLGNQEKALEYYTRVLEDDPSNFSLWQNVLSMEMSLQKYEAVINHAKEALELFPNQSALYYYGGTAHLIKKNYKSAIRIFEQGTKYVNANPQLETVFYGQLGDAYNGIGDHAKSDASYEKALSIDPNNDHVLNNYSYFLSLRKENLDKASEMSAKLVEKYPTTSTYLDTHAWVLYMQGEYQQAKKYLEKAMEDEDVSGTIVEHYGDVLYQLGDVEAAVKQWERAAQLEDASDKINKKIADKKLYE